MKTKPGIARRGRRHSCYQDGKRLFEAFNALPVVAELRRQAKSLAATADPPALFLKNTHASLPTPAGKRSRLRTAFAAGRNFGGRAGRAGSRIVLHRPNGNVADAGDLVIRCGRVPALGNAANSDSRACTLLPNLAIPAGAHEFPTKLRRALHGLPDDQGLP